MTSGELFYSYGFPSAFASNIGLDEVEMESIYFIADESGKTFLVIVHDMIGNSDGGTAKILIQGSDLINRGVGIQLFDDIKATNKSTPGTSSLSLSPSLYVSLSLCVRGCVHGSCCLCVSAPVSAVATTTHTRARALNDWCCPPQCLQSPGTATAATRPQTAILGSSTRGAAS